MMIVTEPLTESQYQAIGAPTLGLCFADHRHLVIYGQITHDRRVAFGGRGAPYHFGSRVHPHFDSHGPSREALHRELVRLFPPLAGVRVVRHWGGPLGVSRDWLPRVTQEPGAQLWRLGGYAGDGVSTSLLAAKVTAKAVLGQPDDSAAARVLQVPPREWEPEPLRWIGVNAGLALTRVVDELDDRGAVVPGIDRLRRAVLGQS
jgi:glycine/D-amino acid oxidase-like deaminating enzyme